MSRVNDNRGGEGGGDLSDFPSLSPSGAGVGQGLTLSQAER